MFVTESFARTSCAADAVAMVRVWRAAALVQRWEVWSVGVAVWSPRAGRREPQVVLRPLVLLDSGVAPLRIQAMNQARLRVARMVPSAPASLLTSVV